MTTEEHIKRIEMIKREKLPYDYYWIDAGWYGPADSYSPDEHEGDWSIHVGDWSENPRAHPYGIRYISDKVHDSGMKFLLWVEPERAVYGTPITIKHPELFLGEKKERANLILNMSDDRACDFIIELISDMIKRFNMDCFREDFNFDPLSYWQGLDTKDRVGISEIKTINNTYRFWDTLLKRFPNLIIDNCSSGGRRLDWEMIGRSIALWRSDYQCNFTFDPIGAQIQQTGLSKWIVNHTGGVQYKSGDTFRFRSCMSAGMVFHYSGYEKISLEEPYDFDWHRKMMSDFKRAKPYYTGDFYALIPAVYNYKSWAAYQCHREYINSSGILVTFREEESPVESQFIKLKGLKENNIYTITDADNNNTIEMTGKELMNKGIELFTENPRESKLIFYEKK